MYKLPDILLKQRVFDQHLFFYQELSDTKEAISEEPILHKTN